MSTCYVGGIQEPPLLLTNGQTKSSQNPCEFISAKDGAAVASLQGHGPHNGFTLQAFHHSLPTGSTSVLVAGAGATGPACATAGAADVHEPACMLYCTALQGRRHQVLQGAAVLLYQANKSAQAATNCVTALIEQCSVPTCSVRYIFMADQFLC